jgi:Leucine-rich repeat (LRR) protein
MRDSRVSFHNDDEGNIEKSNNNPDEDDDVDEAEELVLPHVFYLRKLKQLDLSANALAEVPADFGILNSSLVSIDLSHNMLTRLDTSLCRGLCFLRELNLAHNRIGGELNDKVRELSQLVHLNLSHNRLTNVTYELCSDLKNLVELDLSHNELETMPVFSVNKRPHQPPKSAGGNGVSKTTSAKSPTSRPISTKYLGYKI